MKGIGILKPGEAGARAKARVAEWEAGKRRAKPESAPPVVIPSAPSAVAAQAAGSAGPLTFAHAKTLSQQEKDRLLVEAAKKGDTLDLRVLLETGANANAKDGNGNAALMVALTAGKLDAARMLMERGADPNDRGKQGITPLILATLRNWEEIARELLKRGADPDLWDDTRKGPLDYAVIWHKVEIVDILRAKGAQLNAETQRHVDEQLLGATLAGDVNSVVRNLRYGADRAAKDGRGMNALMLAAERGHLSIVRILLDNGFDAGSRNTLGSTALSYVARVGQNLIIANALAAKGADVNAADSSGWTALMGAALHGHADMVKWLLDRKADVDAKNANGNTALMLAAEKGRLETVQVLVVAGADVNLKDAQGNTTLKLAKSNKHDEVVKYLKAHGAKRWFV